MSGTFWLLSAGKAGIPGWQSLPGGSVMEGQVASPVPWACPQPQDHGRAWCPAAGPARPYPKEVLMARWVLSAAGAAWSCSPDRDWVPPEMAELMEAPRAWGDQLSATQLGFPGGPWHHPTSLLYS